MDKIQKPLIKLGHRDLAQEYYEKVSSIDWSLKNKIDLFGQAFRDLYSSTSWRSEFKKDRLELLLENMDDQEKKKVMKLADDMIKLSKDMHKKLKVDSTFGVDFSSWSDEGKKNKKKVRPIINKGIKIIKEIDKITNDKKVFSVIW